MENKQHALMKEKVISLENELSHLTEQLKEKTREIEVEKALEQLRIIALEMRSSSQLSETSVVLFQQLKELKIDAVRSGLGIFDDANNAIDLWISSVSDEGKLFFVLDYISIHIHPVYENIIKARNEELPYALSKLEGAELLGYYRTMSTYLRIPINQEKNACEFYYSFFFKEGTLNVITKQELNSEEINIMLRLTRVFGLLYTRFLDLQKAEKQAAVIEEEKVRLEATLENLKATQAQLIQSEKMASLGELTAGIAHEIQNPLNFVNNFSEVNKELIEELKNEKSKPINERDENLENELLADIVQNLEKISHHGKRADGIVKGMLQHSRSSSGTKEPTDINALADEYLRLAYHGLRAKDKSFNATIKTEFDNSLEKVNVIPQDIGRVILNLITNAFYVVNQKQKQLASTSSASPFEPTVIVTTKKINGLVEVTVADNGNGIPQKILDKIFQPFFTTKPTGQGTGLGLSLSFDIVKTHAGEIKVESKEGEGTVFSIHLPLN